MAKNAAESASSARRISLMEFDAQRLIGVLIKRIRPVAEPGGFFSLLYRKLRKSKKRDKLKDEDRTT